MARGAAGTSGVIPPQVIIGKPPEREYIVLSFDQFMLLHGIIMAYPRPTKVSVLNPHLAALVDNKFVKAAPGGGYLPTEEGVRHVAPKTQSTVLQ